MSKPVERFAWADFGPIEHPRGDWVRLSEIRRALPAVDALFADARPAKADRIDRLKKAAEACGPDWTSNPGCWSKLSELARALADFVSHDLVGQGRARPEPKPGQPLINTPAELIAWRNAIHPEPSDVELIGIRDRQWLKVIRALANEYFEDTDPKVPQAAALFLAAVERLLAAKEAEHA